jgi:nitroreductase
LTGSSKKANDMDTFDAIHSRRSIRQYQDKPVPEEVVRQLLAAAMQAPSARNQQPWQFVVIDDRATPAQIPSFMPNAAVAATAPMAILVCGDLSLERSEGYCLSSHQSLDFVDVCSRHTPRQGGDSETEGHDDRGGSPLRLQFYLSGHEFHGTTSQQTAGECVAAAKAHKLVGGRIASGRTGG